MRARAILLFVLMGGFCLAVGLGSAHACYTDADCSRSTGASNSTCVTDDQCVQDGSCQCSIPREGYSCDSTTNTCVLGYNGGGSEADCEKTCGGGSDTSSNSNTDTNGSAGNTNQDSLDSCTTPPAYSTAAGLYTCNYCFSDGSQANQCRTIYPCALNGGCNDGPNSGAKGGEYETQADAQAAATRDGCSSVQQINVGYGLVRPDGLDYYWIATDCPGQGGTSGSGTSGSVDGSSTGPSITAVMNSIAGSILSYRNAHPLVPPASNKTNSTPPASGGGDNATQTLLASLQNSLQAIQAALTTAQGNLSQAMLTSISNVLTLMTQLIQSLQAQGSQTGTPSGTTTVTVGPN